MVLCDSKSRGKISPLILRKSKHLVLNYSILVLKLLKSIGPQTRVLEIDKNADSHTDLQSSFFYDFYKTTTNPLILIHNSKGFRAPLFLSNHVFSPLVSLPCPQLVTFGKPCPVFYVLGINFNTMSIYLAFFLFSLSFSVISYVFVFFC